MNSKFRINPLNQNLLRPGLESKSLRSPLIGASESTTISRKWIAGNTAWLEIICTDISFSEKFSVLWVAVYLEKPFVLLQQEPAIDYCEPRQFILRIINENTLLTVDARLLELLIPCFEESFKNRAPWVAADSAQYFGELPMFGTPAYAADKKKSDDRNLG